MAALVFGTTQANSILDTMLGTAYLSLHTGDPGATGANEVTGGSYARQLCAFDAAASKATSNTSAESFTGMPDTTADDISHIGLWSASSGGTFLCGGAVNTAKVTNSGDTVTVAAGAVDIALP